MKYYFIVNPNAGKKQGLKLIESQIEALSEAAKEGNEFITYLTKAPGHATELVKEIISDAAGEEIVIFACGGDGTCFEVLNGIVPHQNVRMGILPVGSCNDFLKSFPQYDFANLENLINASYVITDVIKVNDEYCLNVANFGFDARTNDDQLKLRYKFKNVKTAYNVALAKNILSPLGDKVLIKANNQTFFEGKSLLFACANAQFYGGGYKCAPHADLTDGLIDLVVVKKISVLKFIRLVKYYKQGIHLDDPRFNEIVYFIQTPSIEINSEKELVAAFDGETRNDTHYEISILNKALKFVVPKESKYE